MVKVGSGPFFGTLTGLGFIDKEKSVVFDNVILVTFNVVLPLFCILSMIKFLEFVTPKSVKSVIEGVRSLSDIETPLPRTPIS